MTQGHGGGDFDDQEPEPSGPLLPPEDRLWRHPSEIAFDPVSNIDAADVRMQWLAREPTRATAWTAALVGALVATGIVLVGTHLGTVLRTPVAEQTAAITPVPATIPGTSLPQDPPRGFGLGATLSAAVRQLGLATVEVETFRGPNSVESLGIVVNDSTVVTAAAAVTGATGLLITAPHSAGLVGTVIGKDSRSGLAVLHVNSMERMTPARLSDGPELTKSSFVIAITAPGGAIYAPASLTAIDQAPTVDGLRLIDAADTDLLAAYAPLGSPVLDDKGKLLGLVVGFAHNEAVVAPTWLIDPVVDELGATGSIERGWMGINGETVTKPGSAAPEGVRVLAVTAGSAAANAGIKTGDIIESVDSVPVSSITALQGHLYVERPGTVVTVEIARRGAHVERQVELAGAKS